MNSTCSEPVGKETEEERGEKENGLKARVEKNYGKNEKEHKSSGFESKGTHSHHCREQKKKERKRSKSWEEKRARKQSDFLHGCHSSLPEVIEGKKGEEEGR